MLLVLSAAAVLPQLLRSDETTYTLATTAQAPADLVAALDAAAATADFTVRYEVRADDAGVRQAVRDGDATAGLVGDTLYTSMASGTFPVLVAQSMVALEASRRLIEAGLSPAQIADVQSVQPPRQVDVGKVEDARAVVGFAVGIVLFMALTFAGNAIATTVAMEKSTRISEVLLAVLRPSQVLVGTVAAVGAVTLLQRLVLVTPLAVAVQVMQDVELPPIAGGDLAIAIVWFVLGFVLYAFLFAAAASLVDKITEVSSAILPVTLILTVSYLIAITVVAGNSEGVWGSSPRCSRSRHPSRCRSDGRAARSSSTSSCSPWRSRSRRRSCSSGWPRPSTGARSSSPGGGSRSGSHQGRRRGLRPPDLAGAVAGRAVRAGAGWCGLVRAGAGWCGLVRAGAAGRPGAGPGVDPPVRCGQVGRPTGPSPNHAGGPPAPGAHRGMRVSARATYAAASSRNVTAMRRSIRRRGYAGWSRPTRKPNFERCGFEHAGVRVHGDGAGRHDIDRAHVLPERILGRRLEQDLRRPRPSPFASGAETAVTSMTVAGSLGAVGKAASRGTKRAGASTTCPTGRPSA